MSNGADTKLTLEGEAAAWAARIDAAPDSCPPGLETWLKADPVHAGALLRAQAALAMFGADQAQIPVVMDEQAAEPTVPAESRRFRLHRFAVAGVVALAAAVGLSLYAFPREEDFQASTGEVRSLTLHDGSAVTMDSGSRIAVRIGERERHVRLVEGQAMFRVRHDAARPFQVRAGDVVITDVGTAFQVTDDNRSDRVTVLVSEGIVIVRTGAGVMRLTAGQQAAFPRSDGVAHALPVAQKVALGQIDRALGWTSGQLDLDGDRLGEAVAEMNRRNRLQIQLADPRLAAEPLYGQFRMNDPVGFAQAAAASMGTQARVGDGTIVIAARKN